MRNVQLGCKVNQGYSQYGIAGGRLFWQGQLCEVPSKQYPSEVIDPALDFSLAHGFISRFFLTQATVWK